MGNHTNQPEFTLLGLSDLLYFRIPLILLFLATYVASLAGNLLIIILVVSDSHLQTPMYFFLGNLAILDIVIPSASAAHLPASIFTGNMLMVYWSCIAQVFFFSWFVITEAFLLAVMSYDRYVAICHPLHYTAVIRVHLCLQLASGSWVIGSLCSLLHTLCTLRLVFCDSTTIPGLFCEIYHLINLSCSDTSLNELLVYLQTLSFGAAAFSITFLSYVYVFRSILRIKMADGRMKAFSTCSSHLTVVSIYYVTSFFNYFQPETKNFLAGRMVSVVYTVFTPFFNPVLYSLRNSELKGALHRSLATGGLRR